ncbi:MAG: hypothetical protein K9L68_06860 [Spirochaetales bacterium]|nr:hypothetical protein [Spirochaetales bacterium]MCF7938305.1 hypothetical protein [Spirochaetales bacterium]
MKTGDFDWNNLNPGSYIKKGFTQDAKSRLIQDLRDAISKNETLIREKTTDLGKAIAGLAKGKFSGTPLEQEYERAASLIHTIEQQEENLETVQQSSEELENVKKEIAETENRLKETGNRIEAAYANIGAAAFTAYWPNREQFSRYAELFSELSEMAKREEENKSGQTSSPGGSSPGGSGKKFFDKALNTGRQIAESITSKTRDLYRQPLLKRTGERVVESDFPDVAGDSELDQLMNPVKEDLGEYNTYKQSVEELKERKVELEKKIRDSGVVDSTWNPERRLNAQIEKNREMLSHVYFELGSQYLANKPEQLNDVNEVTELASEIDKTKKKNAEYNNQIERLNAAIEIDKLEERIQNSYQSISSLNEKIQMEKQNVEDLEQKKAELEKKRGSEKTLMKAP